MRNLKSFIVSAILTAALTGTNALADPLIGFDPTGTGSGYIYADLWTNLTDTGLVVGFSPGASVPSPDSPYDIDFIYQARIGNMSLGPDVVTPSGLNVTNELTFATSFTETVNSQSTNAIGETILYSFGEDPTKVVNLFYDTSKDANPTSATGYTDGTPILTAHLLSLTGNFTSFAVPPLAGTGTGSFDVRFAIDWFDPNYIDVATGGIIGVKTTGSTNLPPFFHPSVMWDGTETVNGIPLKVDGSESFVVPEPSTMLLTGLGLMALAGGFIRRKQR